VHTDLEFARWNSGYGHTVETADVLYRLQLNLVEPSETKKVIALDADLLAGSNLGPPHVDHERDPEGRTTLLVYRAQWRLTEYVPRTELVLGRQIYWDLLGMGGLDGASLRVRLPAHFQFTLRGGWSLRNQWSPLSPVQLQPLDSQDDYAGYIVSTGLTYTPSSEARGRLQYRRVFDTEIENEEAGWGLQWTPFERWSFEYVGIADLVYGHLAETEIGITTDFDAVRARGSVQYVRPRFSHHSIWHAFAPAPFHALDGQLDGSVGRLNLSIGGDVRQYQGMDDARFGLWRFEPHSDDSAYGIRAGLNYGFDPGLKGRQIGIHARGTDGFGGRYGTASMRWYHPIRRRIGGGQLSLDGMCGISYFEQNVTRLFEGHTLWTRWAFPWVLREGLSMNITMDSIFGPDTPRHTRFGVSMKADTWW